MKPTAIIAPLAALVSLLLIATSSYSLEPPRVILHSASVKKPTVSADFQGIYGLAQDQTTIECRSTGILEDNLLALAGAQMPGAQNSTAPTTQAH